MYRRRDLKFIASKSKVKMLGGEKGLVCKVIVIERMKYVLRLKYFGYMLDESGIDGAKCVRKVESERKVAGAV